MEDQAAWRPLPGCSSAASLGFPMLLVSSSFGRDSYRVHITDLANIWSESLDKKGLVMRGLAENTSIDPLESDQRPLLLAKIRSALDPTAEGHELTSLTLSVDDRGMHKAGKGALVLVITCILPEPLKPLKWPMYFVRNPPSALATELVLPLIQAHRRRCREVESLEVALREKDAVITRLVDKLEGMGAGLEHIFNQLSGKRKVSRAVAEEKVKGLAPFESDAWRKQLDAVASHETADIADLVESTFGGEGLKYSARFEITGSAQLDNWWETLSPGVTAHLNAEERSERKARDTSPSSRKQEPSGPENDSDDFQVQATPPHLMGKPKRQTPQKTREASTSSDDDGEPSAIPDSHPMPPSAQKAEQYTHSSRLGSIGIHSRKRTASPEASPPAKAVTSEKPVTRPPAHPSAVKDNDDESETASEAGDGDTTRGLSGLETDGEPSALPESPPKKAPRSGGLGRIGGRSATADGRKSTSPARPATASSTASSAAVQEEDGMPVPTATGKKVKLGHIGGVTKKETGDAARHGVDDAVVAKTEDRGKNCVTEAADGDEQETVMEKADRKRAALEKELQRKAAAAPAKKKRKF